MPHPAHFSPPPPNFAAPAGAGLLAEGADLGADEGDEGLGLAGDEVAGFVVLTVAGAGLAGVAAGLDGVTELVGAGEGLAGVAEGAGLAAADGAGLVGVMVLDGVGCGTFVVVEVGAAAGTDLDFSATSKLSSSSEIPDRSYEIILRLVSFKQRHKTNLAQLSRFF